MEEGCVGGTGYELCGCGWVGVGMGCEWGWVEVTWGEASYMVRSTGNVCSIAIVCSSEYNTHTHLPSTHPPTPVCVATGTHPTAASMGLFGMSRAPGP